MSPIEKTEAGTTTTEKKPAAKRTCKTKTIVKKPAKTKELVGSPEKVDPKKENGGIYYVSPHGDKGWKIMKQGGSKALFVYDTKAETVKKARELGKDTKSSIIIKGKDGKIKESINYKD